jgi:hypothetical protein
VSVQSNEALSIEYFTPPYSAGSASMVDTATISPSEYAASSEVMLMPSPPPCPDCPRIA